MTANRWDDSEYPYTARYVAAPGSVTAVEPAAAPWRIPWRAILIWTRRLASAAILVAVVSLALFALFGYRIIAKTLVVKQLQAQGCHVAFEHQVPGQPDPLPGLVRNIVGDDVWSDVTEVTYGGASWGFFGWQHNDENVNAICQACSGLTKLRSFGITSDVFSFSQISSWPHLDQLEQLEIGSANLTDDDLTRISRMPNLKVLKLRSPNLTISSIDKLAALSNLETLELESLKTANPASPPPSGFDKLTRLVIREAEISDETILSLGPLPRLVEVVLDKAAISDRGLAHLVSGGNVQTLIVNDADETDYENSAMTRCPGPAIFHLADTAITDDGLGVLAGLYLSSLVLDKTAVTDEGLRVIGQMPDLRHLSLRETKVTGLGVSHLSRHKYLTQLDFSGAAITSEGIAAIAQATISEIALTQTPLTDDDLMLFSANDRIGRLNIMATRVTAPGLRALYEARKQRLAATGRTETLVVISDFADVTAIYVDPSLLSPMYSGFAGAEIGY